MITATKREMILKVRKLNGKGVSKLSKIIDKEKKRQKRREWIRRSHTMMVLLSIYNVLCYIWNSLWWEKIPHSGHIVYGQSYHTQTKFKTGNLAILIALIALILVIIKLY